MKREEFKELCNLSQEALGHRYAWKKLRSPGLVHSRERLGKGFIARRMPLTTEQVKHYLNTTINMKQQIKQESESK